MLILHPRPLDFLPTAARVVVDTNVALDWLVFHDTRVLTLIAELRAGRLVWLACPAMRDELAQMLASRSLAHWAPDAAMALQQFDTLTHRVAEPRATLAKQARCTDPDDQVFVDLALEHGARWLLTHDRALLRLSRRTRARGVEIVTPMTWSRSLLPV